MEKQLVASLDIQQTVEMFKYVGKELISKKPFLTEVDSVIGDGDHGIGMEVGFRAAAKQLETANFSAINDVFKGIGMAMLSNMGGASGVIFGTMFISGIKDLEPKKTLTLELLSEIFQGSLLAIKKRGKADLGDKTMVDAFEPAVIALKGCAASGKSLLEGINAAEAKAAEGVENSKGYIAKFGRAKSLGERAIGHQDAGATSVWLIFKAMREWLERND